jgi:tetratricopeptide (TPR) repeat protein
VTTSSSSEQLASSAENPVKHIFQECLANYRKSGAEPLRQRLPDLLALTKSHPTKASFRLFVTDLAMDLGLYDEAIGLIEESLRLTGPCDILQNNLAYCHDEMDAKDLAYKSYVESIRLNPANRSSLRGACFLAIEGGHHDEALDYCGRFHATGPAGIEETLWFALALRDSGEPEQQARAERLISESDPALNLRGRFDRRE